MKNSLESLRAEAERQKARAEGLAEQVAALTKESNRQSARIMELNGIIKHIRLVEAGKRGALAKQLHQLIAEHQDLQLERELIEERCAATQKENIESKLLVDKLQKENDEIKWEYNNLQTVLTNTRRSYVREIKEWDELTERIMSRNLWQRIINKPVTISGETETTEGHEQKPEVPATAEQ